VLTHHGCVLTQPTSQNYNGSGYCRAVTQLLLCNSSGGTVSPVPLRCVATCQFIPTLCLSENVNNLDHQQGSPHNKMYCTDENFKYWIGGFYEGEGSFNVSFKLNTELRMGIQVAPEISITQHKNGKEILDLIKSLFGGIGSEIKFKSGNPNVLVYTISNISELRRVAIPFLLKYNAYSARKNELECVIFVCEAIANKQPPRRFAAAGGVHSTTPFNERRYDINHTESVQYTFKKG